jgi:hypothetical protein
MRALSTVLAIALVAAVVLAAVVLLATGKGFVYSPGVGSTRSIGKVLSWGAITSIVGMGLAAALHGIAHKFPKTYFQTTWWRDLALVVSLLAALAVVLAEMVGVLTYGAF